jgi:putative transcriptional regulator
MKQTSTIQETNFDDDRDAPPMTPEQLRAARLVPRVKTLRMTLGLTQDEFAARYKIPVGTLRDWEQSRAEPDAPARAYLQVIAGDPEGVMRALAKVPNRN